MMNKQTNSEAVMRDALKMAIDDLELCNGAETVEGIIIYTHESIQACKEALDTKRVCENEAQPAQNVVTVPTMIGSIQYEQPTQEPVAWISVNDRLPDNGGKYIVYGNCTNDGYQCDMAIFSEGKFRKYNQPTHWMPLPKTPNETNTHPAPKPAQEPVAWIFKYKNIYGGSRYEKASFGVGNSLDMPPDAEKEYEYYGKEPLYTHPAPSWQGLSDDEVWDIAQESHEGLSPFEDTMRFARAIEQALKEKNGR